MGNHDFYFLKYLKGQSKPYAEADKLLSKISIPKKSLIKWMEEWPYYIDDENFIAVHAAFDPSKKSFKATSKDDMISARYFNLKSKCMLHNTRKRSPEIKPWYHVQDPAKLENKITVFGHWAQPLPRAYKNFRCLDSGCCYGGHLSCLSLPDDKIIKTASRQPKKFNY